LLTMKGGGSKGKATKDKSTTPAEPEKSVTPPLPTTPATPTKTKNKRKERSSCYAFGWWWNCAVFVAFLAALAVVAQPLVKQIIEELQTKGKVPIPQVKTALASVRVLQTTKLDLAVIFRSFVVLGFYGLSCKFRDFSTLSVGLTFTGISFLIEIGNALFLHFTNYSPLWLTTTPSLMLFTVGFSFEVLFLTLLMGIVFGLFLPESTPRVFFIVPTRLLWSCVCAFVATVIQVCVLHPMGFVAWKYAWWEASDLTQVSNIMLFAYLPAFLVASLVAGAPSPLVKVGFPVLLILLELSAFCFLGPVLHWI